MPLQLRTIMILFGRYDVILEPKKDREPAMILEFKVQQNEKDLDETAREALRQIEEKNYAASLIAKGINIGNIRTYGFAFRGKQVLILNDKLNTL